MILGSFIRDSDDRSFEPGFTSNPSNVYATYAWPSDSLFVANFGGQ